MASQESGVDYFNRKHPLMQFQGRISLHIRRQMFSCLPLRPTMRVLEFGATPDMDLVDSNFFSLAAKALGHEVSVTSVEDCSEMAAHHGLIWIPFDRVPGAGQRFDMVISSAVLEHVGGSAKDKAEHLLRLRDASSDIIAVTTPNRGHWLELHTKLPFIHWLPKPLHRRLLAAVGLRRWADPMHLDLLNAREFKDLVMNVFVGDDVRFREFRFLGGVSNLMAIVRKKSPDSQHNLGAANAKTDKLLQR